MLLGLVPCSAQAPAAEIYKLFLAGRYGEAAARVQRALATDSTDLSLWYLQGQARLALLQYERAEQAFLRARRIAPDTIPVLLALGQTTYLEGHDADAIRWYGEALRRDPSNLAARTGLARACYRHRQYEAAIHHYRILVKKHPGSYAYNKELGQTYLAVDSLKKAQWYFHNAVNINNGDLALATRLARLYIKTHDYKLAADIALLGLRSDTTWTPLLETLGFARYRSKDYRAAADAFGRCLHLGDSSLLVLKHLGYIYLSWDRLPDAERMLLGAWKQNNTLPEIAYYLGLTYENMHKHDTAARWLEKALVLYHPPAKLMAAIYRELANNYYLTENWTKAFDSYREALSLDPENDEVLFRMAEICDYHTNEKQKAIYYYRRVVDRSKINPATWDAEKTTTIPLDVTAWQRINAIKEEMHFEGNDDR